MYSFRDARACATPISRSSSARAGRIRCFDSQWRIELPGALQREAVEYLRRGVGWYDPGMTEVVPKQKVSVSLDADVVAALEAQGPLSPQVNATLRAELERTRQAAALDALVATLTERYGLLDTAEDKAAIERYVDLLS